jgi:hypothetical protein
MFVMPGLVPGIHVLWCGGKKDVDGREKPGHDESELETRSFAALLTMRQGRAFATHDSGASRPPRSRA